MRPGETVNASGDQVVLKAGDVRLTVVTAGGGMRELMCGDWPVIMSYGIDEVPPGGSGQPLIPWPNRLAGGSYEFAGKQYQVPINEPALGNALHGFARWMTWSVEEAEPSSAVLSLLLYPRAGYPFALHNEIEYAVHPGGVNVAVTARNVGRTSLPYANGFHPYISAGSARIDSCLLSISAETWLRSDERQIPIGRERIEGSGYDFRARRRIGSLQLDTAFTDLVRDQDGKARVELVAGEGERSVAVWMDPAYGYVMAYTGDKLDPTRRRSALAVEPMTAAPNALRSGEGLRVLAPGETFRSTWGIEIRK